MPHCALVVTPMHLVPSQQPALQVFSSHVIPEVQTPSTHAPEAQVWQAAPFAPQAVASGLPMHCSPRQQPAHVAAHDDEATQCPPTQSSPAPQATQTAPPVPQNALSVVATQTPSIQQPEHEPKQLSLAVPSRRFGAESSPSQETKAANKKSRGVPGTRRRLDERRSTPLRIRRSQVLIDSILRNLLHCRFLGLLGIERRLADQAVGRWSS
jgi:hypothetical protein